MGSSNVQRLVVFCPCFHLTVEASVFQLCLSWSLEYFLASHWSRLGSTFNVGERSLRSVSSSGELSLAGSSPSAGKSFGSLEALHIAFACRKRFCFNSFFHSRSFLFLRLALDTTSFHLTLGSTMALSFGMSGAISRRLQHCFLVPSFDLMS